MMREEASRYQDCRESLNVLDNVEEDENEAREMCALERAALALAKMPLPDEEVSEGSKSPKETCRLRVPQDNIDDTDDNFVADTQQGPDNLTLERTVAEVDGAGITGSDKRTKDQVDVAAAGIPLEVRRFQCTKSTLALKEATKNDATPQSTKLVDYIVSLTFGGNYMCTEKEMCKWLVAQMCDRVETGQAWVITKTCSLLSRLLWRGSRAFVDAVHEYGKVLFQASHIEILLRTTEQENISGDRLPCSLQPIKSASCGQKSAAAHPKPPQQGGCFIEVMKEKACIKLACKSSRAEKKIGVVPEDALNFLISTIAYLESLCEYRVRHPTLDLAHGEILMVDPAGGAAQNRLEGAAVVKKTYSPTAWKELLDDTLELMKAIAVLDPNTPLYAIGRTAVDTRVREAVLLYQIACRALVRLLHSVLTMMHTFVASLQSGLQVPSSNLAPSDAASEASSSSPKSAGNFLGGTFDPTALDYTLTPDIVHGFAHEYYHAIYQFNRTVSMLRCYCEATENVNPETSKRALHALKLLPEDAVREFKESRKRFEEPVCSTIIVELYRAAREAADQMRHRRENTDPSSPTAPVASAMLSEDVRRAMLAVYEFHLKNKDYKEKLYGHQVDALCSLFDEKEAKLLHQVFYSGLTGWLQQWQEFVNNGAAAAEKALDSLDSKDLVTQHSNSSVPGLSASDNGASDTSLRSSTYILRSLPSGVRVRASSGQKTDVITLDRTPSDTSTESSIDALLQEDDVVVICNEECSCNDTLKLVDRFQVLMDVPLGEGSYGKVYRAWDEVIGCYLAAKELPLDASKAHNVAVREVLQEYTVLTELSHPNIVRVVAFMVLKRTARIYMEWMPSGSLQDVLRHHPRGMLRESVVRRYARDVLSGLAFLHSRGVIHRDVKPGNMLLSSDGAVKLTDFGTSLVLSGNHRTLESNSVTGTAAYMAPECVQGTYSSASDIWSFGCSVVQLISGNVPWCNPVTKSSPEPIALLFKIGSLDDTTHLERPHDFLMTSSKAETMDTDASAASLSSLQSPDMELGDAASEKPKDAPSAELMDMLNSIFVVDRKKRPTASQLLQHPFFKIK